MSSLYVNIFYFASIVILWGFKRSPTRFSIYNKKNDSLITYRNNEKRFCAIEAFVNPHGHKD